MTKYHYEILRKIKSEYLYKKDLIEICKNLKISTKGGKIELINRIKVFIKDGSIKPDIPTKKPEDLNKERIIELDYFLWPNFKASYEVREFIEKQTGETFKYTVSLQKWIKDQKRIKFKDLIERIKIDKFERKQSQRTREIGSQFQYMQYTRDFFNDEINSKRTRSDCIKCWKYAKSLPGEYKRYDRKQLKVLENTDI